ncbi:MAG: ABC transporter permease [Planctomycetota bacterium]
MRNTVAIMQRELLSLFCSPIAYIVIAGFWLVTAGMAVWNAEAFGPGKPATLRDIFMWTPFVLTIVIPAMAMRTIAEEVRSGTFETLMTAPVSDAQVVLGKYFATVAFYLVMIAGTLVLPLVMALFGNPDWGEMLAVYVGLVLVGVAFTAFSLFASSLTRDQAVAWILGAIPLMLLVLSAYSLVKHLEGWAREVVQEINIMGRFAQFARGQVETDAVVLFLAVSGLFLFLTVKIVESRRWR